MALTNLFTLDNPNTEQQLVLNMIEAGTHKLELSDNDVQEKLTSDVINTLQQKGYTIELERPAYIATDYDAEKLDIEKLTLTNDTLVSNNIPSADRLRSYITRKQAEKLVDALITMETELRDNKSAKVLKSDVQNKEIFNSYLNDSDLEVSKEFKNHYRIRITEPKVEAEKEPEINLDMGDLDDVQVL